MADIVTVGSVTKTTDATHETAPPASLVSGNKLVMFVNIPSGLTVTATPTGWTELSADLYHFSGSQVYLYERTIGTGGGVNNPVLSLSGSGSCYSAMVQVDNYDTGDFLATNGTNGAVYNWGSSGSPNGASPAIIADGNASTDGSLAIGFFTSQLILTGTYSNTNSFTPVLEFAASGNAPFWIGKKTVNTGAVGTTDITNTTGIDRWATYLVVVNPGAPDVFNASWAGNSNQVIL